LIATRIAGTARFEAVLSWRGPEEMPPLPTIPAWSAAESARISVSETEDPESPRRRLVGEISALTQPELGSALEAVLRSVTTVAALTEAVLEVRAVRTVTPKESSPATLQALARDLGDAGFPVRFAPSWTPAPEADVCLGVGGANGDLRGFLSAHPLWRTV
jgi:hypothetical protein